ncbi:hypothetical protein EFR01_05730 [Sinorhizobium fredii]|nr:hypothetical protein EFR01_05730 [Sinorhizobium fredii]GLS09599.1 hypothetical protein GCM10007864_32300 [Sinorhizobium fredii]
MIDLAVGHRDAGIGKPADARGDARHDTERDAVLDERQGLLAAAAEDKGVAALEAQYPEPGACELDEAERDVALLWRGLAAAFAGKFERDARLGELQAIGIHQRIMNDYIRLPERIGSMQRQEARIAGAGADKPDGTGIEFGKAGKKCIRHGAFLPAWQNSSADSLLKEMTAEH